MHLALNSVGIRPESPGRRIALLLGAAIGFLVSAPPVWSHPPSVVVSGPHATGHVNDHADLSWPPQPRGIRNVVDRSDPGAARARRLIFQQSFGELERRGADSDAFRAALGQRFTRVAFVDVNSKSEGTSGRRFTYFSHSRNATVEVVFDGAEIESIESIPAAEYQPEITDEEAAEAIELSRRHFRGLGRTRIASLKGYVILAYQPEGKGFYENRVVYVSFHAGDDAPPELMAWVDLTDRRILKTREERR